jgi:exopolysaccharide biosynthesis polyprenyl glycosylphosphotransferase
MRSSPPEHPGATQATASGHLKLVGSPAHTAPAPPNVQAFRASRSRRVRAGRVRWLVACDLAAMVVAYVGAFGAAELLAPPATNAPAGIVTVTLLGSTLLWLGLFAAYRLYEGQTRNISPSTLDEMGSLFHALLVGSFVLLVVARGLQKAEGWQVYTAFEACVFVGLMLLTVPAMRSLVRSLLLPRMLQPRRALIVGAGDVGQHMRRKIEGGRYGLDFVGFIDDDPRYDEVVGRTFELTRKVDELDVDWVILTTTGASYDETLDRVRAVRRPDVHLSIVPSYFELFASNASMEDIEGVPVVNLPPLRFSRSVLLVKRTFDVMASGLGLFVLSPLLAAVALMIKLDSPGPVFFRQARHGRGGKEFRIVKFRTMVADAESKRLEMDHLNEMEGGGPLFKMKRDPRITRVGARLRQLSIDELPQLWNVLRGEMSLVGPRPFVVHESERITGWANRRLETTPGITGLWQALGRNEIPFEEMVKLDYVYVTNWSLWWDVKILCQTIPVVFGRRGAY